MEAKLIKTETEYKAYLAEVERLAAEDPPPGTKDGDRLELFAKLVEDYEKEKFRFDRPDPISAIRFRMHEQGLRQKDIALILGGKNRASEILAGKRPLTLSMIRALSDSLRIPADLLIQEREVSMIGGEVENEEDQSKSAVPTLIRAGLLPATELASLTASAVIQHYLKPAQGPLYLRRTITYGATPSTNKTNLRLWVGRVREMAAETRKGRGTWRPGTLNEDFLSYVAQLSWWEHGPKRAQEFLAEKGIALILLPKFPNTRLDGAAMLDQDGAPIVGLTIRFDRLDSFWFTLLHELVHVWKHLPSRDVAITDESDGVDEERDDDSKEVEANRLARDAFIPKAQWRRSEAFLRPSVQTIVAFANKLHISPAIVAGRLRREKSGYGAFTKLIGNGQVQQLFPDIRWS